MKRNHKLLITVGLITIGILWASCCPMNPKVNSVLTAHGNTDWHIDTAEEFLTGFDMVGNPTATNHCPNSWTKNHMHVGLTSTGDYYNDISKTGGGKDNDATNGIDRAMLFFYAGHGNPTGYSTLSSSNGLANMLLGNCDGSNHGVLRYFWQCSCEVFAHGPKTCPGETWHYTCPGDFDGSNDSDAMRNVFERWGPILSPELRMACGSSSAAYCHESETNRIWDYYNNHSYDVADAFIYGLHRLSWNTPLCITTGGWTTSSTPLYDATFTNQPNPSGPYLHIQYLSEFDSNVPFAIIDVPPLLPVFSIIPMPLPEPYEKYEFKDDDSWRFSTNEVKGREVPEVKVNKKSGAIYFASERAFKEGGGMLDEKEYIKSASEFMRKQGWMEKETAKPEGQMMMVETRGKEERADEKVTVTGKNATVTFRRQIMLDDGYAITLGEGGKISIQLNPDGSVYNASKVWRPITEIINKTQSKPFEQALEEALEEVPEREAYELENWTWGYEESPGNVEQTELRAVYVFYFAPVDMEKLMDYPPMAVKVSAHLE